MHPIQFDSSRVVVLLHSLTFWAFTWTWATDSYTWAFPAMTSQNFSILNLWSLRNRQLVVKWAHSHFYPFLYSCKTVIPNLFALKHMFKMITASSTPTIHPDLHPGSYYACQCDIIEKQQFGCMWKWFLGDRVA